MNRTHTTTTVDALAPHIGIEAADPSTPGATIAEAMATAGTLELITAEWAAMIGGFRRDGAERIEEEFDWIGAATLQS